MYEVDIPNRVCGQYKIVDQERVILAHEADLPLESCDGMFGFSTEDAPKVLKWTRDTIQKAKKKCTE